MQQTCSYLSELAETSRYISVVLEGAYEMICKINDDGTTELYFMKGGHTINSRSLPGIRFTSLNIAPSSSILPILSERS